MDFKMIKMKKRFTAMMCAIIGVMSCLPVSAANRGCSHPHMEKVCYEFTYTEKELCGCCACVSCEAESKYVLHSIFYECHVEGCDYFEFVENILDQVSHICYCTTCECNCEF